jgi:hypothetical protein
MSFKLTKPVLLLLYDRLDTTFKVLEKIREVKPSRLYIAADGYRRTHPQEKESCEEARKIVNHIDWDCEIKTLFPDENSGPRVFVGGAISWFFEQEEDGIVLEHDCVPDTTFFSFCETLLDRYKDDERIMHISGDNFQYGKWRGDGSYYFSRYNHIWGFATWRRAWKHYDNSFSDYESFVKNNLIDNIFSKPREKEFWLHHFRLVHEGKIVTWDAQWTMNMWMQNGLAILPNVNLVSNIGFGDKSLNTAGTDHRMAAIPTQSIKEIKHPKYVMPDTEADYYGIIDTFSPRIHNIAFRKLKNIFR